MKKIKQSLHTLWNALKIQQSKKVGTGLDTDVLSLERDQLEGTPFWIVGNKENGYNLVMGKWRLNDKPFKTKNKLMDWMITDAWNLTVQMQICICEDMKKTPLTSEAELVKENHHKKGEYTLQPKIQN